MTIRTIILDLALFSALVSFYWNNFPGFWVLWTKHCLQQSLIVSHPQLSTCFPHTKIHSFLSNFCQFGFFYLIRTELEIVQLHKP